MFTSRRNRRDARAGNCNSRRTRRTFALEPLEERVVLSPTVYTVNTSADGTQSGTLRSAIIQANDNTNIADARRSHSLPSQGTVQSAVPSA